MEEPTDFQDWELLHGSETSFISTLDSSDNSKAFEGIEGDSEGAIKSDYFALDFDKRYVRRTASEEDSDERSLADSDNPSWVDPESDSRYLDRPKGELGFAGIGFPCKNSGGFWSDESSDGQRSSPGSEKGELCNVGFQEIEVGHQNSGGDDAREEVGFGVIGETGIEIEKPDELGSASLVEKSTGNGSSGNHCVGEGDKRGMVWWKLPLELLKFCVFRVRPVWSISIAAAIMGFVMLGRKLYKMKHKTRSIPLKVSIDDKLHMQKASQFMVRAARLNEAFSVVRRVPVIRASLPTGGVTPWPVVSLR